MELHVMIVAILIFTLLAIYAIRRAEKEIIERYDPDQRSRTTPPLSP
jgi:hypothetical protein